MGRIPRRVLMKKAKNAHVWTRDPHDWYVEPSRCTTQLCEVEKFTGSICDPTCGQGNIVLALHAAGYPAAFGLDLVQRVGGPWHMGLSDFLAPDGLGACGAENIVFNPPFYKAKGAEACIRRALDLASGKVAAFTTTTFLSGHARAKGLFKDHPPTRVWLVAPRASCPPGSYLLEGHRAVGGAMDWAWLVWDKAAPAGTSLGWLK